MDDKEGATQLARACRGKRPGDLFADMLFSFMLAKRLKTIYSDMDGLHLISKLPVVFHDNLFNVDASFEKTTVNVVDSACADDMAFFSAR